MTPPRLGVESDSLVDVEVGAVVWSKTVQQGDGFAGGPVINVYVTEDGEYEFGVLRWRMTYPQEPYRHVFDGSDVNMAATTFFAADARKAAAALHAWIGSQKNLDAADRVGWSDMANDLDRAALTGSYTPRAERRYRARFDKQAAS